MKALIKKPRQFNNTPNSQKSPNKHSTSSYYVNILKQSDRFNSIQSTSYRTNVDNLSSPNPLLTKNTTAQTPAGTGTASKMLHFKNRFLNLTSGDVNPKEFQKGNLLLGSGKDSTQCLSSLDKAVKTEGNLPTSTNSGFNTAVEFLRINQKVVVTPRNFSQQHSSSTIEIVRPSPIAAKRELLRTNSAYKFPLNSPKVNSYHSGKTLSISSIDNANKKTPSANLSVGPSSAINKNKSLDYNNSANSNIQRYTYNPTNTNDSIDHYDTKPFNTIGTSGVKDEEEKCLNHPHKKVKYFMSE